MSSQLIPLNDNQVYYINPLCNIYLLNELLAFVRRTRYFTMEHKLHQNLPVIIVEIINHQKSIVLVIEADHFAFNTSHEEPLTIYRWLLRSLFKSIFRSGNKENPLKYKEYDLHVFEDSHEIFDEIILFKLELSCIEDSVRRKEYLLQHAFIEVMTSESTTEKSSLTIKEHQSTIDETDQTLLLLPQIESNSLISSSRGPDCQLLFIENIKDLSPDHFIDKLDDDESTERLDYLKQMVGISFDPNQEKQLSYFEQLILERLDDMNIRLSSLEEKVSYLYERQSILILIELLTKSYLIDVRQLDTRVLSAFESEYMHLFFRFVAQRMKNDYENKWKSIKGWLGLSLCPKSIEYNLLGFGIWNKIDRKNLWKSIRSPNKPSTNVEICNRSSYVSFENSLDDLDQNLVVIFEATTAKISFVTDVLRDIGNTNQTYSNSMKTLLHKLAQLERQVYYLSSQVDHSRYRKEAEKSLDPAGTVQESIQKWKQYSGRNIFEFFR